jgi:hypothetical protein
MIGLRFRRIEALRHKACRAVSYFPAQNGNIDAKDNLLTRVAAKHSLKPQDFILSRTGEERRTSGKRIFAPESS